MRKAAPWLVAFGLLVFAALFVGQAELGRFLSSHGSFTKSVDVKSPGNDRATYYRFKASFAYRGEPLDFDIVVGCNVRVTTYKDNGRTVEVGIAPMAFGLKMKDGHGVVIRPPQACSRRNI